ncbi:perilipin-2-like [Scyliorhinus canicula]|uniref:perilipin-2-like n=1 Tax=Scyliorhinus canicula TaxID=7830 RepID=UPI0018F438FF|nr:perilipin-2-like [Scyliorhinus canicula]XP_038633547.1 perilipin-2-like [Scyliorhinus canicula]
MASTNNVANTEGQENGNQNVVDRVTSLPLVSSACEQISGMYMSTKESSPAVKTICDMTEQGVKTISTVAATGAKPILDKLEPQIAVANEYACKGLDKLEEKLPILHQVTDQVLAETKELVSSKMANVKESVMGVVDMTTTAVQGNLEKTKAVVVEGASAVGQLVTTGVDISLLKTEELVDHYLPMTKEELAKVAVSTEGSNSAAVQEQSYYVRLGSLSSKVRNRAYQYSISKMQRAKQNGQETLSHLHNLVDLIESAKRSAESTHHKLEDVRATLTQILVDWRKQQPDGKAKEELEELSGKSERIESETLAMTQNFSDQLQTICQTLASSVRGLPENIEDQVQQVCKLAKEIYTSLSSATSFQDLSAPFLTQTKEQMLKIREGMDGVMDYLLHNTPLNWLVGPFIPQLAEDQGQNKIQ